MRSTFKVIGAGILMLAAMLLVSLREQETLARQIEQRLLQQCDSLSDAVRFLKKTPQDARHNNLLQQRFKLLRLAYKRLEWAVEYFDPVTSRLVNGPPVPEAELNGQVIQPDGLQVIEECLYPRFSLKQKPKMDSLLSRLADNSAAFHAYFEKADLQDWQILDAVKQEVFRVETLGLNDFDDPLLKNCFNESAAALQSVQQVVEHYGSVAEFGPATRYLERPAGFNSFDRANYILQYANPLTRALTRLHNRRKLPDVRYNRLLNQDAATLFDENAFNSNAFTASPGDSATTDKITLGKRLFFDPVLSGNGKRSCASCHDPERAFTDGLTKNLDLTGKRFITRNTPTLINAALQPALFYDLRSPSLEDQANDVVQNQDEMHGDMKLTVDRLWRDSAYRRLFDKAYPLKHRVAIDTFEVMNAIAGYVRSLTALDSRFDKFMHGKTDGLSADEINGFNLFMGKARCSTCHYMPLFSGALPPRYNRMEAEVIGVPKIKGGKIVDPDPGTHGIQPLDFNRHAFKVTTLRNAACTAPYMHNGVFKTLEEVVDFYNDGGGAGEGLHVPNQTLSADRLHLSAKEKKQLIAFINSLNSQSAKPEY